MTNIWEVVAIITWTTATLGLGGWIGYQAGHDLGQADTMNDFVNRCLEEPVPTFCQALIDELGNVTTQPTGARQARDAEGGA